MITATEHRPSEEAVKAAGKFNMLRGDGQFTLDEDEEKKLIALLDQFAAKARLEELRLMPYLGRFEEWKKQRIAGLEAAAGIGVSRAQKG